MSRHSVIILSGSCCNPHLAAADELIKADVSGIANELGTDVVVRVVGVSSLLLGGTGMGAALDDEVRRILRERGFGALPIVVVDGAISFWGQRPTAESLKARLCAIA